MGSAAFWRLAEACELEEAAEELDCELALDEELDDPEQPAMPSAPHASAPAIPIAATFLIEDDLSMFFLSYAALRPQGSNAFGLT